MIVCLPFLHFRLLVTKRMRELLRYTYRYLFGPLFVWDLGIHLFPPCFEGEATFLSDSSSYDGYVIVEKNGRLNFVKTGSPVERYSLSVRNFRIVFAFLIPFNFGTYHVGYCPVRCRCSSASCFRSEQSQQ